ncbi:hypothetical protein BRY73_16040 [Ochrobactrum sp. P6BS-III]|uniref:hypothetical protein n=1 Tax=unclassified Ochrobactrum TaxID=239106 RepID=UPI0009938A5E|nr:hypothetical protein [Ochrobactrum sp. P6BSIII]OOL15980.1 hypothetical protein BRY73_16040 [Ochrobactrum sp. P6BS-III]
MKVIVTICAITLTITGCASSKASDPANKELRCQQLLSRANIPRLLEAERAQAQAEATQLGCS